MWFKVTCASSVNFKIMLSLHMQHVFQAVVLDVCRWWEWEKAGRPSGDTSEQTGGQNKYSLFLWLDYDHRASRGYWLCCWRKRLLSVVHPVKSGRVPIVLRVNKRQSSSEIFMIIYHSIIRRSKVWANGIVVQSTTTIRNQRYIVPGVDSWSLSDIS